MPALRALLLLALAASLPVQAQIYQWVDADGRPHFGTQPPSTPTRLNEVRLNHADDGTPVAPPPAAAAPPAAPVSPDEPIRQAGELCRKAVQQAHEAELPRLKAASEQRLAAGRIDAQRHQQILAELERLKTRLTLPTCLASQDAERAPFECLARGEPLAACDAGAARLAVALEDAAQP